MAQKRRPLRERFEGRFSVNGQTGCWDWTASKRPNGYGQIGEGGRYCKVLYAHRVAYELYKGPIPAGLDIDHLCRNRGCVNPDHLEAVTRKVNLLRGNTIPAAKARQTHCLKGHAFDEINTRINNRGTRECKQCSRERQRKRPIPDDQQHSYGCKQEGA